MSDTNSPIQTPFLDVKSFFAGQISPQETETAASQGETASPASGSPFLSVYQSEEEGGVDPRGEEYVAFLTELHDEEFDEALFELVNEAAALYEERFSPSSGPVPTPYPAAERALEGHFEPLIRELEGVLDSLKDKFGQVDGNGLKQGELEAFFDGYTPSVELSPSFEYLFGSIFNKIKNVASKAAGFAGNLLMGPIFDKLKALVRPFFNQVLSYGISRLPLPLQPVAQKLAQRLGLMKEFEVQENEAAPQDVSLIQHRFNQQLADLLFAENEVERELEVSRAVALSQVPADGRLAELDYARERFVEGLRRLKEGEEATPLFENFLPALLPVLKLGLRLAGRSRVIDFLAKFLAKLIGNLVGPENAPALSRAIVDAGFKMLSLEAGPQGEAGAAAEAVAATVEDTVRRVAALPEYILENQELLEAATLEAFEQAAGANLPPILSEEAYQKRPDLREARSLRGAWVSLPLVGRKRYKKFCVPAPLRVRITPQKAGEIESFDGVPLAEFLAEQLGMPPGQDLEADLHLYESIPGTTLPELARHEKRTPGLGDNTQRAYGQIHPLTPKAAGILLGEPALGRPLPAPHRASRFSTQPGQRYYYLDVKGARPALPPGVTAGRRLRHHSGVRFRLDLRSGEVRVRVYLSEIKAQALAVKLRQQGHAGAASIPLRALLERDLACVFRGGCQGRIKIIHESVGPQQALGAALQRIPPALLDAFSPRLQQWIMKGLADFLKQYPQQVLAAADAQKDGITLVVTIGNPPGLDLLRQALKGRLGATSPVKIEGPEPALTVTVVSGFARG